MALWKMVVAAVGLAADAFAVSVAEGIGIEKLTHRHTVGISALFGLFQGMMPILGWLLGASLRNLIGPVDHWIAFGLLTIIGCKMLMEAAWEGQAEGRDRAGSPLRLVGLAVATSMDALALGVTLAMLQVRIWAPAAVIGLVTAALCAVGIQAGDRIGPWLGRTAEVVGGCLLVGLGFKILAEHLL